MDGGGVSVSGFGAVRITVASRNMHAWISSVSEKNVELVLVGVELCDGDSKK